MQLLMGLIVLEHDNGPVLIIRRDYSLKFFTVAIERDIRVALNMRLLLRLLRTEDENVELTIFLVRWQLG